MEDKTNMYDPLANLSSLQNPDPYLFADVNINYDSYSEQLGPPDYRHEEEKAAEEVVEVEEKWILKLLSGDGGDVDDDATSVNITQVRLGLDFENDDAAWIMACTFIIFTMQTGHGFMESGMCSMKNEVSILMKNVVSVALGGMVFWAAGFGLAMGEGTGSNPFCGGLGHFFFSPDVNRVGSGELYLRFFLQVAFVSSCTTIVSGGMAERCNIKSFMLFSLLNVLTYSLAAHWVWGRDGFLRTLGVVDVAGSGAVHALGGMAALVSALMLGPRLAVERQRERVVMGNAQNSLIGLFMIWWAFLAFNSGSTFGVTEDKWMFSSKATVTTMVSSFGGGCTGLAVCYVFYRGHIRVAHVQNCVYASLVAITGGCYLVTTWQAFMVGAVAAMCCYAWMVASERWMASRLDDPCCAFAVHGAPGAWGMLSVGIFAKSDPRIKAGMAADGVLSGGGFRLLGVQALAVVVIMAWGAVATFVWLKLVNNVVPLRMSVVEELLGADYAVHNILHPDIGVEEAVAILREFHGEEDVAVGIQPTGNNLGHMMYLEDNFAVSDSFSFGSDTAIDAAAAAAASDRGRLRRASIGLSLLFGEEVTDEDVAATFGKGGDGGGNGRRHPLLSSNPRRSELREHLSFERHLYMPSPAERRN